MTSEFLWRLSDTHRPPHKMDFVPSQGVALPPPEPDYSIEYWEKLGEIQVEAEMNGSLVDSQLLDELAKIEERDRRRAEDDDV